VRQVHVERIAGDLLELLELFSRSYAQFISEASGNAKLASQIHGFRHHENPSLVVPYYWDGDDFASISKALESLIIELGWKK
jgi:hypothetical protein